MTATRSGHSASIPLNRQLLSGLSGAEPECCNEQSKTGYPDKHCSYANLTCRLAAEHYDATEGVAGSVDCLAAPSVGAVNEWATSLSQLGA